MASPVRAVVFDVGGVIARQDAEEADAGYASIDPRLTAREVNVAREGPGLYEAWVAYSVGDLTPDAYWTRVAARLGLDADPRGERLRRVHARTVWSIRDDGVLALVRRVGERSGMLLGVLSNSGPEYVAHVAPFRDAFQVLHFSHLTHRRKPDPGAYLALTTELGVAPDATVFIDDKMRNVIAARALGMHSVHFRGASELESSLKAAGALDAAEGDALPRPGAHAAPDRGPSRPVEAGDGP